MLTDALLQLSSAQAVTATAVSANTIDLSQARDLGAGEDLEVAFTVDVAATAAGAATVAFEIISSAAADLSSPTVLASTGAIPKADLTIGRAPIFLTVAQHALAAQPKGQRYLGARYTVATGPLTAGSFTANVVLGSDGADGHRTYPSGFTVA